MDFFCYEADLSFYSLFVESLAKINAAILVKTTQTCVLFTCVHPPTSFKLSTTSQWFTALKFTM